MKRLKIAYVTVYDAKDIHNWSGLGYYIAKTLEKHVGDLDYIGNLRTKKFAIPEAKRILNKLLFNKEFWSEITPEVVGDWAKQIEEKLDGKIYDIIFCPGSRPISMLKTNIPIVTWTDSCHPGLMDFYAPRDRVANESLLNGIRIEKHALDNTSLLVYSSEWAASIARNYHKISPSKIKVVPFGANVENEKSEDEIRKLVDARPKDRCKLLFVGVEWVRKGGDVAFKTAQKLNDMGLKTELSVVGCEPIFEGNLPDFVKSLGFISKSTKEGRTRLNKLFEESHFLIVPSLAEAYGLVFCEANSFGVPAISRKLGGITTIIRDDINGKTFPVDTAIDEYANYIYNLMNDFSRYSGLCLSSFNEFITRLNWDSAGETLKIHIEELLELEKNG